MNIRMFSDDGEPIPWQHSVCVESQQIPKIKTDFEADGWTYAKSIPGRHTILHFVRYSKPI